MLKQKITFFTKEFFFTKETYFHPKVLLTYFVMKTVAFCGGKVITLIVVGRYMKSVPTKSSFILQHMINVFHF